MSDSKHADGKIILCVDTNDVMNMCKHKAIYLSSLLNVDNLYNPLNTISSKPAIKFTGRNELWPSTSWYYYIDLSQNIRLPSYKISTNNILQGSYYNHIIICKNVILAWWSVLGKRNRKALAIQLVS